MRELEFLPDWYPQIRRRKRMAILQGYMVLVMVGGLGLWTLLVERNLSAATASVSAVDDQLTHAQRQVKKLDEAIARQGQLRQAAAAMHGLGGYVEATRIISNALAEVMPPDMGLLDLALQTEETFPSGGGGLAAARALQEQQTDRSLRVKLTGVVPTDVDLATFLAKLGNLKFIEQVAMTFSRDRIDGGHLMREFEVTFSVSLGGAPSN
jgi:Tfp pilus assembly protein PilN